METNFSTSFIVFLGMISSAMAIKCYEGSSDAAKQLKLENCSDVNDACGKVTTAKGWKMFCTISAIADKIEENCDLHTNQKCFCQKDGCNEFKMETTTIKATTQTTKKIVNAETTKQGNTNNDKDNERRSAITTPSSNSGLSHNEMHVFKIAGIVSMVTALLLTN